MPVDRALAAQAIELFLSALGQDPAGNPELRGTPARVASAWSDELVDGYDVDVAALLAAESSAASGGAPGLVVLRDATVSTVCPHHLLPARGHATVAYLPGARISGIGTLARVVSAFAHRLTLQETIGAEVASALVRHLGARGAACRIVLAHDCLSSRGEREEQARVETLALSGSFERPGPDRELVLAALGARA